MPDSKTLLEWREFVADSHAIIKAAVDSTFRKFNRYAPPEDVEEVTEDIIKLLLNHDCRIIKTYDESRSNLRTWLTPEINHEVWAYLQRKRKWDSLDETFAEKLFEQPKQELNIILQEQQIALAKEIAKLSEHDRRLILLIYHEVPVAEIAKRLNIKPESVHRMKHQIIQKIKAGVNKKGGTNIAPEFPKRKMKIIKNNQSTFFSFAPI